MSLDLLSRWSAAILYHSETAQTIADAVAEALAKKADLSGANLYSANLYSANLYSANLSGADLRSAEGINKYLTTPLHMLRDQPGKIRAYKLVTAELKGPHFPSLEYVMGLHMECAADTDEAVSCSHGLNVATLDWVMREWQPGFKILIIEHTAADIAAIPLGSDGKYRVHQLDVVGEKSLEELGLVVKAEVTA